jgi:hypothetical protein
MPEMFTVMSTMMTGDTSTPLTSEQSVEGERTEDDWIIFWFWSWFRGERMEFGSFHQWIQKHIIKMSSFWGLRDFHAKLKMKLSNKVPLIRITVIWIRRELSALTLLLFVKHSHMQLCLNMGSWLCSMFSIVLKMGYRILKKFLGLFSKLIVMQRNYRGK